MFQVEKDDGLPHVVCLRCFGALEFTCDFYESCRIMQNILQGEFGGAKAEGKLVPKSEETSEQFGITMDNFNTICAIEDSKPDIKSRLRVKIKKEVEVKKIDEKLVPAQEKEMNNWSLEDIENVSSNNQRKIPKPCNDDEGVWNLQTRKRMSNLAFSEGVIPMDIAPMNSPFPAEEAEAVDICNVVPSFQDSSEFSANASQETADSKLSRLRVATLSKLLTPKQKADIEKLYYVDMSVVIPKKVNLEVKTLGEKFVCEQCNATYTRIDKCRIHVWRHLGMQPFFCKSCSFSTVTVSNIRSHVRKFHLKIKPYKCHLCEKRYPDHFQLEEHVNGHIGYKSHCSECPFACYNKQVMSNHMATHDNSKGFFCDVCKKGFPVKTRLRVHLLTHNRDKAYNCTLCSRHFVRKETLDKHYVTAHNGDFICNVCNKVFNSGRKLYLHENVHKEGKYECDVCGNVYKCTSTFKEHVLKHKGIRKFKCEECEKTFAQSSHLVAHKAVHSDVRYNCPGCERAFNRRDNMKAHSKCCSAFQSNPALRDVLQKRGTVKSKNLNNIPKRQRSNVHLDDRSVKFTVENVLSLENF